MTGRAPARRLLIALRTTPALVWRAAQAWATLEPADWSRVADLMVEAAALFPANAQLQRWAARVLRAARRSVEAIEAARRALANNPDDASALLELGRALRQAGLRGEAIATLSQAARLGATQAAGELRSYAARSALPLPDPGTFARASYADYVAACNATAAPAARCTTLFSISIEGDGDHAVTRASLARQTYPHWQMEGAANCHGGKDALTRYHIDLQAGAILDRQSLAWLNHAIVSTAAGTVRADHDYYRPDGLRGDPVLLPPKPDRFWTEGSNSIVRFTATAADGAGGVCHVPRVLLSLPHAASDISPPPTAEPVAISVVIPSRDNPAMLDATISSLRATASRPDLLEVIIVDNGSVSPQARGLLQRLRKEPAIRVIEFDEPFNWSRSNNLGASVAKGKALLFLNDDTELQTPDWDRILAAMLGRAEVGLVGARMVYPDGTIQHGGFVFGMDNGPQHEGRWMDGDDCGPAGRWTAIREAAGVTGAFLAIRAADFHGLGGFDELAFAVDFADLDLCLRVRTAGQAVVYCGAISLIHHESASRGLNISRKKRRRMRQEWRRFRNRWGGLAEMDPWYHPAWSRKGASYDGLEL